MTGPGTCVGWERQFDNQDGRMARVAPVVVWRGGDARAGLVGTHFVSRSMSMLSVRFFSATVRRAGCGLSGFSMQPR